MDISRCSDHPLRSPDESVLAEAQMVEEGAAVQIPTGRTGPSLGLPRPGHSPVSRPAPARHMGVTRPIRTLSSSRSRVPAGMPPSAPLAAARPYYGPPIRAINYCCIPVVGLGRWLKDDWVRGPSIVVTAGFIALFTYGMITCHSDCAIHE